MSPGFVRREGLLFADGGEVGVQQGCAVHAIEFRPVLLVRVLVIVVQACDLEGGEAYIPGLGAVFCFCYVVISLAVSSEEEDTVFDSWRCILVQLLDGIGKCFPL